jgi:hypothetical protein
MEFRFEDILKNIIPGFLVVCSLLLYYLSPLSQSEFQTLLNIYVKDYSAVVLVLLLSLSYVCGYIIDALSSWLEHYIIYKILGTPAYKLIKGIGKRITFNLSGNVIQNLDLNYKIYERKIIDHEISALSKKQAANLFKLASIFSERSADDVTKQKLKEYYYAYIFSRNIFFSVFFSSIIVIMGSYQRLHWAAIIIIIILNVLLFFRRRDKSYYYSRQILIACTKNS